MLVHVIYIGHVVLIRVCKFINCRAKGMRRNIKKKQVSDGQLRWAVEGGVSNCGAGRPGIQKIWRVSQSCWASVMSDERPTPVHPRRSC